MNFWIPEYEFVFRLHILIVKNRNNMADPQCLFFQLFLLLIRLICEYYSFTYVKLC